jgi:Ca2+-binding RTX toxin-like protein
MNRTMNRPTMLALLMVAVALLLASGVVLARDFSCGPATDGPCVGTKKNDRITGTTGDDEINARSGRDSIVGDPFDGDGDDVMRGGDGDDSITDNPPANDVDTIFGGKGDDTINVREGASFSDSPDFVDCGPGDNDVAIVDPGDTRLNCEIVNP